MRHLGRRAAWRCLRRLGCQALYVQLAAKAWVVRCCTAVALGLILPADASMQVSRCQIVPWWDLVVPWTTSRVRALLIWSSQNSTWEKPPCTCRSMPKGSVLTCVLLRCGFAIQVNIVQEGRAPALTWHVAQGGLACRATYHAPAQPIRRRGRRPFDR